MTQVSENPAADRYLHLLARVLTRYELDSPFLEINASRRGPRFRKAWAGAERFLAKKHLAIVKRRDIDYAKRAVGTDAPGDGETMVGLRRLENLQVLIRTIVTDGVPGDLLEAGVWRGGASIFMRAAVIAYGSPERDVWLADSFAGLPPPDLENFPQDKDMNMHLSPYMIASLEDVQAAFERYALLDEHVHFVKGWFKDTLPTVPVAALALLRVDGDMYESTWQVLESLYDKVSSGGFVVVDDYNAFDECRQATDEFRRTRGVADTITEVDWTAVYWRKP